ncbi:MAG: HVO_0476 family zinc finger protein, partial [Thermoplasmata archaeon]
MTEIAAGPEADKSPPAVARIQSVSLPCENCGRTTPHRVVRWDPRGTRSGGPLAGVARCQECRWTHPFTQVVPSEVEVALVVSDGERSERIRVRVPAHRRLQVGSGVPGANASYRIR